MIIAKTTIRNKIYKDAENSKFHYCNICNKLINLVDIENRNFEYARNKNKDTYVHLNCLVRR